MLGLNSGLLHRQSEMLTTLGYISSTVRHIPIHTRLHLIHTGLYSSSTLAYIPSTLGCIPCTHTKLHPIHSSTLKVTSHRSTLHATSYPHYATSHGWDIEEANRKNSLWELVIRISRMENANRTRFQQRRAKNWVLHRDFLEKYCGKSNKNSYHIQPEVFTIEEQILLVVLNKSPRRWLSICRAVD